MSTPQTPPGPQQPDQPDSSAPPSGSGPQSEATPAYPSAPPAYPTVPPAYPSDSTGAGTPPPYAGTPAYPSAGAPQYPGYAAAPDNGTKTLAIVSLVLAAIGCTSLVGLVLAIVTLVKKRGTTDTASKVMAGIALAVSVIWLVIGVIVGMGVWHVLDVCAEQGPGTHYIDGVTYTCS
ncbi:hypothetical protein [Cellulomonas sp. NPDC089187]|uniref:DUF4190 domain-containing protein n=1 Tax=Cellulomonas sp. NPDC089187 TaxID=3154970 RepID=UPI00342FAD35